VEEDHLLGVVGDVQDFRAQGGGQREDAGFLSGVEEWNLGEMAGRRLQVRQDVGKAGRFGDGRHVDLLRVQQP
jgi:hypothetical protein